MVRIEYNIRTKRENARVWGGRFHGWTDRADKPNSVWPAYAGEAIMYLERALPRASVRLRPRRKAARNTVLHTGTHLAVSPLESPQELVPPSVRRAGRCAAFAAQRLCSQHSFPGC